MQDYIVIVTERGLIMKFKSKEVRAFHRDGKGVKAMMVGPEDKVVSAFVVQEQDKPADPNEELLK